MYILTYIKNNSSTINDLIGIVQGMVIIFATLFTARWTYKTFAHKEKISELKEFKKTIGLLYWKMTNFCSEVRKTQSLNDEEFNEKMELMEIHNKLISILKLNLYIKIENRKKILNIVGKWVTNSNIKKMEYRNINNNKERENAWNNFEQQYKEVEMLIDKEADKIL